MMSDDQIIVEAERGIVVVTLNRPEQLNAFTTEMYHNFCNILDSLNKDDSVKAIIITGAGRGFCSGSDVSKRLRGHLEKTLEESRFERLKQVGSMVLDMDEFDKPIIAAINGVAAGAGLSVALASHIRLASEKARFGAVWVNVGLIPDLGATYYLPRIVGLDKAFDLSLTGRIIDAKEALEIGLVTKVVPHGELIPEAKKLAAKIATGPAVAVELIVRGLKRSLNNDLRTQLDYESYAQNVCRCTHDHKEGVRAFLEKRKPRFKGI